MRVSIETAQGLTRKMTIAVPSATFEGQFAEHVRKAAGQAKLPGFRPGKVPISEVQRRFGPQLRQEVASELLETSFKEAVRDRDLSLASRAEVEIVNLETGADFEFTATFEVLPEFEVADLSGLKIRRPLAEVSEQDIDHMVDRLRRQHGTWQAVDREAREGDRVTVDYSLTVDGEIETEREGETLIVGSDGLRPELEGAVRGMSVGSKRAFPMTLPARPDPFDDDAGRDEYNLNHLHDHDHDHDHDHTHVAEPMVDAVPSEQGVGEEQEREGGREEGRGGGREEGREGEPEGESTQPAFRQAVGQVTLQSVEESSLPDLDDDFLDRLGISPEAEGDDRLARFRTNIRERMTIELGNALRETQRHEVLGVLARSHHFELPQALVDAEVADERARLKRQFPDVPDELPPVFVEMAESRVRVQLTVNKIVADEEMTADDERVRERIDEVASAYEESAQVRSAIYGDEDQFAAIETLVLEEQVVDHLLTRAQVEEVPASYDDVINDRALAKEPEPVQAIGVDETADEDADEDADERTDEDAGQTTDEDTDEMASAQVLAADSTGISSPEDAQITPDEASAEDDSDTDAQDAETAPAGLGGRFRRFFGKRKAADSAR